MNKAWVQFHMKEALDELSKLLGLVERSALSEEEFEVGITHAYHHLNTAWNSRAIDDEQARQHSDYDFVQWRQFPADLNL